MPLDPRSCYRALSTHDRRFDGRFFVGVATTGIYCRPVCTVRTPRVENCRFFKSAAAAEQGGYRPCLRCRPELAPGNASIDSSERLAHMAVALIENGVLEEGGMGDLAQALGITTRHLRRIFLAAFGVSPIAYAQTHRLLLAKRLLTDTQLPVTDVAFAAGFNSVRRFNALFASRYRLAPARLRRNATSTSSPVALSFELAYRPPYHWQAMLDFLAARAIDGVEHVDSDRYVRSLRLEHHGKSHAGWIAVSHSARRPALVVEISTSLAQAISVVLTRVRHAFDTSADPEAIASALGTLGADAPGVRVPGSVEGFEVAVRAVVGQQISVAGARTLLSRIALALGTPSEHPLPGVERLFPTAHQVSGAGATVVATLGILPSRARTLVALAHRVAQRTIVLDSGSDVQATMRTLRSVPGIGEWTAEIIAMRALGWPDAFPASDVALLRALGENTAARAKVTSAQWQPWRSYAVMHLWRQA
ncbi:MAG: helix-turn-helix domain-containing protein [Pseudomonadota bacterium]|nr:helix-turn-helix domain-containing protein [Pseudomonadota bacterium]